MKKSCLLLTVVLFTILLSSFIQSQTFLEKKFGNMSVLAFDTTAEGGFVMAGHVNNNGNNDAAVIKVNAEGRVLWSHRYGGNGNQDGLRNIKHTSDNNFLLVGYSNSFRSDQYWDLLVIKIDTAGNVIWSKDFGGIYADEGWDVIENSDGSYIIAGYTKSYGNNYSGTKADNYLIKFSSNGTVIWQKVIGSDYNDWLRAAAKTSDGGLVLTGYSENNLGYNVIMLTKVNGEGNVIWQKFYSYSYSDCIAYDVAVHPDGNIYVTGYITGIDKAFLLKVSPVGNIISAKAFGGLVSNVGYTCNITSDGGIISGGYITNITGTKNSFLMKTNSSLDFQWMRLYAESYASEIKDVKKTNHGLSAVANLIDNNGSNTYLLSTNVNGITGCTSSSLQPIIENLQLDTLQLTSNSDAATFVLEIVPEKYQLALSETYMCELAIPVELLSFDHTITDNGIKLQWSTATETNNLGFEIYRDDEKIGFIGGTGTTALTHSYYFTDNPVRNGLLHYKLMQVDFDGSRKIIAERDINFVYVKDFYVEQNYPNPFNPSTTIKYSIPSREFVSLKIVDIVGKEVITLVNEQQEPGNYSKVFNASGISSGIYFCVIQAGTYTKQIKMMLLK